jgi:type I restriction-modification system DNA methylase subunit
VLSEKVLMKVENETGLYRDPVSKVIINKDDISYNKYLQNRQRLINAQQQVEKNTSDINDIKKEVSEIKSMLVTILANIQK